MFIENMDNICEPLDSPVNACRAAEGTVAAPPSAGVAVVSINETVMFEPPSRERTVDTL